MAVRVASKALRALRPAGSRAMSGGHSVEQEIVEMNKWRKITFVAVPCVALLGVYSVVNQKHHDHGGPIKFSYLHMRTKAWPWGGDLGLFELPPKEAKHGKEEAHH